jgi:hypothetical protein
MEDRFKDIKEKVEARNQFLAEHPEMQPLQDIIDERLKKAGNVNNRLAVIQDMMLTSFFELDKNLQELKGML